MISIIGTGRVGSTTAFLIAVNGLDDLVLIDVVKGLAEGIALDISHAVSILGVDVSVKGSSDFSQIKDSDLIIVSAGYPRGKGIKREELISKNVGIIVDIAKKIKSYAPNSVVILTTNPVDILTYLMYRELDFPRERVLGFGGILDSGRYRYYLARKLGVAPSNINALVIGQHGDYMIPLDKYSNLSGIPITKLLDKRNRRIAVEETKFAGDEIINLCGFSSMYGPAAGLYLAANSIINDLRRIHVMCVPLNGEYGVYNVAVNVPVILGKSGVENIVEIPLSEEEKEAFVEAVNVIRDGIKKVLEIRS